MPSDRSKIPWLEVRNTVYYVRWYTEGRKTNRLSLRTSDPMEAQQRYAAFLTEGHAIFKPTPHGITVSQALDDYDREHVATKCIDAHRQRVIIGHLKKWFADTPLKDIDIPACRQYAEARRTGVIGGGRRKPKAEGSEATVRRELGVLSAAARHALRWRRILRNDAPTVELPPITHQEARWLTQEEFQRLVDTATGRLKDFILVAYYTAGRRKSIERLTRFQVDLRNNRINLRGPDEDANQRRSKKRRPVVPIDPELRPTIERLMASPTEWLFGDPRDMYLDFVTHAQALGFDCAPHTLRHSRATHLLQAGVPIYDVSRLLGDTIATVERVYGHHSPDFLGETIKRRTG